MAADIKGITIEFRGDTTKLDSAIRTVGKESRALDNELRGVNKALKFNPNNTQLLAQKQQILKEKIANTKQELNAFEQAQKELDAKEVDKTSEEYRRVERGIIECNSKLDTFQGQLRKAQAEASKLGQAAVKIKDIGDKATAAGKALMPLSAAAAGIDAALGALAYKSGLAADDLNTLAKVSGIGAKDLQKYSLAADLVDVSVETIVKSQTKMKKSMDAAKGGTGAAADAFEKLGVKVTDSGGHLRDQDEVFQETIEALGTMKNDTERDALAMQLFGKSATELNPLIEDAGETYKRVSDIFAANQLKLIDQETLDKANSFNDSIDEVKATGTLALQTLGMQLAGYLAPAMEKISQALEKFFGWLSQLSPTTLTVIAAIAGIVAAVAPLLLIFGKFAFAISSIMTLMSTLGLSFGAILAPIAGVVLAIAGIITIGILLYKNWDKIKAYLIQRWNWIKSQALAIWNGIKKNIINPIKNAKDKALSYASTMYSNLKSKFESIKTAITSPIKKAKEAVEKAIKAITNFFPLNIGKNLLSGIKLPHFKITGSFSIKKKTVPHLSIDWYAKGGIFTRPTVIGNKGFGEAGAEAVLPLDTLWQHMNQMADNIVNGVNTRMAMAGGAGGDIHLDIYLAPNTPKLQEIVVNAYDTGKRRLG